jgi:hypothetical protein
MAPVLAEVFGSRVVSWPIKWPQCMARHLQSMKCVRSLRSTAPPWVRSFRTKYGRRSRTSYPKGASIPRFSIQRLDLDCRPSPRGDDYDRRSPIVPSIARVIL